VALALIFEYKTHIEVSHFVLRSHCVFLELVEVGQVHGEEEIRMGPGDVEYYDKPGIWRQIYTPRV